MGELQPTGRSKLFTHYDNLALGNISTRAAGIHDDISTPGGCWASRGGGGASNVDAPGSNFKLYRERTSSLALEGMMLKSSPIFFALARTPGIKGPRTSGLLLRFACWLFTGSMRLQCCRASCALFPVYGSPDVIFWRGCANQ